MGERISAAVLSLPSLAYPTPILSPRAMLYTIVRSVVGDLDNDVRYLVIDDDGELHAQSSLPADGDPMGVEMHYYCPECDCPNVVAYTTPVPDGCVDDCDHCGKTHDITPTRDSNKREFFEAEDFDTTATRLQRQRKARLAGERTPASLIDRLTRIRLVLLPARVLVVALSLFGALFGLVASFIGAFFGQFSLLAGGILGLAALIAFDTVIERLWHRLHDRYLTADAGLSPGQLAANYQYVRRGRGVQRGEVDLYVPDKQPVAEESDSQSREADAEREFELA